MYPTAAATTKSSNASSTWKAFKPPVYEYDETSKGKKRYQAFKTYRKFPPSPLQLTEPLKS
jgi:hypothetical protein